MDDDGVTRPFRDRAELVRVMTVVLDRVDLDPGRFRLVGTGAALAQGVEIRTGDIDILVRERADVDRFAAALAGFRCLRPPAWLASAKQYYADFEVDGLAVSASTVEVEADADADTVECIGRGPWQHFAEVRMGRHLVGVSTLELRLVSELVRDRPDRAGALIAHLRVHGADLPLLRRSMADRGIDAAQQQRVLDELRPYAHDSMA